MVKDTSELLWIMVMSLILGIIIYTTNWYAAASFLAMPTWYSVIALLVFHSGVSYFTFKWSYSSAIEIDEWYRNNLLGRWTDKWTLTTDKNFHETIVKESIKENYKITVKQGSLLGISYVAVLDNKKFKEVCDTDDMNWLKRMVKGMKFKSRAHFFKFVEKKYGLPKDLYVCRWR